MEPTAEASVAVSVVSAVASSKSVSARFMPAMGLGVPLLYTHVGVTDLVPRGCRARPRDRIPGAEQVPLTPAV